MIFTIAYCLHGLEAQMKQIHIYHRRSERLSRFLMSSVTDGGNRRARGHHQRAVVPSDVGAKKDDQSCLKKKNGGKKMNKGKGMLWKQRGLQNKSHMLQQN